MRQLRFAALLCLSLLLTLSCTTDNSDTYWTTPTWTAWQLSLDHQETLILSEDLAGAIEYRLNVARQANPLLEEIHFVFGYVLNEFSLEVTDELAASFDTASFRFGQPEVDALLAQYPVDSVSQSRHDTNWIVLHLDETDYYNMRWIADQFRSNPGVLTAAVNGLGTFPEHPSVSLEIEGEVYKFHFFHMELRGFLNVWVVDDRIIRTDPGTWS